MDVYSRRALSVMSAPATTKVELENVAAGYTLTEWDRKRRIWTIYLIGFVDLLGVSMMIPFFPRLAASVGASPSVAGLIGSLYGALQVVSSPVVGKLSDVYGRKNVLLVTYLAPFLGYLLMSRADTVLLLVLSRILPGGLKHGQSISKAYLTDIASDKDRSTVLGLFNSFSSLGFIFGPLISGYLADIDPTLSLSILFGSIVFGLDLLLILLFLPSLNLPPPSTLTSENDSTKFLSFQSILDSVNIFRGLHVREMIDILLVRFLLAFAVIMFRTNFPFLLDKHYHSNASTLGKILSFNGVISALSALSCGYLSSFYTNPITQVTHFSILLTASIVFSTLSPSIFVLVLCLIPMAMATANLRICMLNLMLQRGRDTEKGAIIGVGASMASLSRMIAPGIVGVAQELGSEVVGYLCAGLTLIVVAILISCFNRTSSSKVDT